MVKAIRTTGAMRLRSMLAIGVMLLSPHNLAADEDEYYRLIIETFLPRKAKMKSITLPFAAGWALGAASTLLSNALNREHPLFDPSLYSLYSVSRNLDFSCERSIGGQ